MSEESPLSRRQLLTAVGSIGALSTAGASASLGLLGDGEGFAATAGGGTVELDLDCAADGCADGENRLTVPFDGLAPDETGSRRITIDVADGSNPVYLWFRTDCPDLRKPLTTTLEVKMSLVRNCDTEESKRTTLVNWSRFDSVLETLRDGMAIAGVDSACLGQSGQLCLDVEYRLPAGTEWVAGASVDLDFVFAARQCRHADGENPPLTGRECPDLQCTDTDCVELGKAEVTGDRLTPGEELSFEETDGYTLRVVTVTDKVEGGANETVCASFALLKDGSETDAPPICEVEVKGGREHLVRYDNKPQSTRTRGEVCTTKDSIEQTTPAISNVTVYVCGGDRE